MCCDWNVEIPIPVIQNIILHIAYSLATSHLFVVCSGIFRPCNFQLIELGSCLFLLEKMNIPTVERPAVASSKSCLHVLVWETDIKWLNDFCTAKHLEFHASLFFNVLFSKFHGLRKVRGLDAFHSLSEWKRRIRGARWNHISTVACNWVW